MTAGAPHSAEAPPDDSATPQNPYISNLSPEAFLSLGSMEGMFTHVVETVVPAAPAAPRPAHWPGYAITGGVAALAYVIHYLPFAPFAGPADAGMRHPISAAIIAILAGLLIRNTFALPDAIKPGCKTVVRKVIPFAIVCMGAGLNLAHLTSIGLPALLVTVLCVALGLAAGYYFGKLFGLSSKTALLLGAGTGICGNSAIVAVAPLIDAEDEDVVLSVGTVNLFGLLAMLIWPAVGGWLAFGDATFGIWAGTSIHAVPQVVAAGFAFSPDAGTLATLVKLIRVTLLAPMVFLLALHHARNRLGDNDGATRLNVHYARLVPWFVWGFLAFALLNTLGLVPTLHFQLAEFITGSPRDVSVSVGSALTTTGKLLLTLAMAAIGLEVSLRQLAGVGGRAITAGLAATVLLGLISLLLIRLLT